MALMPSSGIIAWAALPLDFNPVLAHNICKTELIKFFCQLILPLASVEHHIRHCIKCGSTGESYAALVAAFQVSWSSPFSA